MSYELPKSQMGLLPKSRPPRTVPQGFQRTLSYDKDDYEPMYYDTNGAPQGNPGKSDVTMLPRRWKKTNSDFENNRKRYHRRCLSVIFTGVFLTVGFTIFLLNLHYFGFLDRVEPTTSRPTTESSAPTAPSTTTTRFTTARPVTNTSKPSGNCIQGYTKFNLTGFCYRKIYHRTNFHGAQQACEAENAQLTSIHSEEENTFLADLHRKDFKIYDNYNVLGLDQEIWIGLHYVDGQWQWVDGSPLDYEKWAPNEPNRMENEIEVTMVTSKLKGFSPEGSHWNNAAKFTKQKGLICKKAPES